MHVLHCCADSGLAFCFTAAGFAVGYLGWLPRGFGGSTILGLGLGLGKDGGGGGGGGRPPSK